MAAEKCDAIGDSTGGRHAQRITNADPIYLNLGDDNEAPMKTESVCTNCWEKGETTLLLSKIPHFKEVIIMSFQCPHCGFANSEVQSGAPLQPKGVRLRLTVTGRDDLDRQIIKSEHATFAVPSLEFEIPAKTQRGVTSTIEGMLSQAADNLEKDQPIRRAMNHQETADKIDDFITRLRWLVQLEGYSLLPERLQRTPSDPTDGDSGRSQTPFPFEVILDDPSGNSHIQPLTASAKSPPCLGVNTSSSDPHLFREEYERSPEHLRAMGFSAPQEAPDPTESGIAPSTKKGANLPDKLRPHRWDFSKSVEANVSSALSRQRQAGESSGSGEVGETSAVSDFDESLGFDVPCAHCGVYGRNEMCLIDIPGFRETLVMAFNCDNCGARSNEVKAAGAIGEKGKRWKLKVETQKDLDRDVLKSDMASLSIPCLHFQMEMGTGGSNFTTVEGLLRDIAEKLRESNPFSGDSADPQHREAFSKTINGIEELATNPASLPFDLILDDPADHSFIGRRDPEAPESEPDSNMVVEVYERTDEQNDDLGLKEMKTEGYEEDVVHGKSGAGSNDGNGTA